MDLAARSRRLIALLHKETALVVALLLMVAGIWAFAEITDEVLEDEAVIDAAVMDWVHGAGGDPRGPRWLEVTALDLTALGGAPVLALMIALIAGFLAMTKQYREAVLVLVASLLGLGLSTVLKEVFSRERPQEGVQMAEAFTASFPSGHTMLSTVIYLTLGAILSATRPRRRERFYIIAAAVLIAGIVGLTRVYLGVHFPTDVLAGWSVGLAWTVLCLIVAHKLHPRPADDAGR
ncbi:MAG: phosphatase PAP2 family protein [Phycisphaerales bacterium]